MFEENANEDYKIFGIIGRDCPAIPSNAPCNRAFFSYGITHLIPVLGVFYIRATIFPQYRLR
jgi:hypothetical protein